MAPQDLFCARCGHRQPPGPAGSGVAREPFSGITPRTASIFCYVPGIGWIAAIVVLASLRFRQNRAVRFHAFQGLYLFVAWLVNDIVVQPIFLGMPPGMHHLYRIVEAILLIMSIFMMVKASQDEAFSLPLFGELAERSVSES